ncbi:MAG TPA: hypothetical protein VFB03_00970 [Candidatus Saccharimonadales bacterium]|nr:hypothetical protein [Candidatus Saccharimonadales bacterium]
MIETLPIDRKLETGRTTAQSIEFINRALAASKLQKMLPEGARLITPCTEAVIDGWREKYRVIFDQFARIDDGTVNVTVTDAGHGATRCLNFVVDDLIEQLQPVAHE